MSVNAVVRLRHAADLARLVEYPDRRRRPAKCPQCSHMVYQPCLSCQLKRLQRLGLIEVR